VFVLEKSRKSQSMYDSGKGKKILSEKEINY